VTEKCRDGWYKGTTVEGLRSGVFPGNYVQHVRQAPGGTFTSISSSAILQPQKAKPERREEVKRCLPKSNDDLIDLSNDFAEFCVESSSASPWTTAAPSSEAAGRKLTSLAASRRSVPAGNPLPPPPSRSAPANPPPPVPARPAPPPAVEKYRCVMAFPSSSEYELDMREGDVVALIKRREDGWCKGTLERTGQTGLFPFTFVAKIS